MMTAPSSGPANHDRSRRELLQISALLLFCELACIRWFPAHVYFLSFFTNIVLLASFLGLSIGCLSARRERRFIWWTPWFLVIGMAASHGVLLLSRFDTPFAIAGAIASPNQVFFGSEEPAGLFTNLIIPIEAIGGFYFLIVTMAFVGFGQELGRALARVPDRITAYSLDIAGSLIGIALFTTSSWLQLSPVWWFSVISVALTTYLYSPGTAAVPVWSRKTAGLIAGLGMMVMLSAVFTGERAYVDGIARQHLWSPYYRIDYRPAPMNSIAVNLIGHQRMVPRTDSSPAYALPHLVNRDSGRGPFEDVLIIGAGSGNDVSRALQWGAKHVDAVEIDPVIQSLGLAHHPDRPYDDPRVTRHLDDGRNFLRANDTKYDLVIYALVDSLILHSGYSNIRLESYLFTQQAFADVQRHLKPNGLFVMYNYYRQGWVVARLHQGLRDAFQQDPILLTYPHQVRVVPEEVSNGFSILMAGDTSAIKAAYAAHPVYNLPTTGLIPESPNGFGDVAAASGLAIEPATMVPPQDPLINATDDWPFLYLRRPMIPETGIRSIAVIGSLSILLLYWFRPARASGSTPVRWDWRMFFLGAGFMLVETKAVVHMALLFGSTWFVNAVVFFAVLTMILAANLVVSRRSLSNLSAAYAALIASLVVNAIIPLDTFLGMARAFQIMGACVLVFAPIFFAGIVFGSSFARTPSPDHAFSANLAGAMLGGLAEYGSMLVGFQGLLWIAVAFYGLSAYSGTQPEEVAARTPAA